MKQHIKQVAPVAYHGKMTQPGVILEVSGPKPPHLNIECVDDWLQRGCLVPVPPLRSVVETATSVFLWRNMQWAYSLCRWVRLPAIDPGDILSLTEDAISGNFVARIAVPYPESIPVEMIGRALALTGQLLALCSDAYPTDHHVERMSEELDRVFLKPMENMLGGGQSTIAMLRSAYRSGVHFSHMGEGVFQVGEGSAAILIGRSAVCGDSGIGARLSHDKFRTASLLRRAGLPVPAHALVNDGQRACEVANRLGYPVVIKPADLDRGEGVTTDLGSADAVLAAYEATASKSNRVLVEKEVPGICYRILVVKGTIAYCTGRRPKGVTGDGVRTVTQLIAATNDNQSVMLRQLRMKPYPEDTLALDCIHAAGFSLDSVPAAGDYVPLRPRESVEWGGAIDVVTDRLHPVNAEAAIAAARLLRLDVCGVDMISQDISVPWYENGAVINELNYAPHVTDRAEPLAEALKSMFRTLVPAGGRIPVHAFVGQAGLDAARNWQQACVDGGMRCFVASSKAFYGPQGLLQRSVSGLLATGRVLLQDPSVDALALVIDSDELLDTGLPVKSLADLTVVDLNLRSSASNDPADEQRVTALLDVLRARQNLDGMQAS